MFYHIVFLLLLDGHENNHDRNRQVTQIRINYYDLIRIHIQQKKSVKKMLNFFLGIQVRRFSHGFLIKFK